jgi:hypothetical protein
VHFLWVIESIRWLLPVCFDLRAIFTPEDATLIHRTNYRKNEPLNNVIINFNYYCDLFGFHSEDSRVVFRDRLRSALL